MLDLVKTEAAVVVAWVAYLATAVFGHVALKLAAGRGGGDGPLGRVVGAALSPWGLAATAAWGVSALAWIAVLERRPLQTANAVSSLRYVLVLGAAWAWFGERMGPREIAGSALIVAGVWLCTR